MKAGNSGVKLVLSYTLQLSLGLRARLKQLLSVGLHAAIGGERIDQSTYFPWEGGGIHPWVWFGLVVEFVFLYKLVWAQAGHGICSSKMTLDLELLIPTSTFQVLRAPKLVIHISVHRIPNSQLALLQMVLENVPHQPSETPFGRKYTWVVKNGHQTSVRKF